jgi:hypothetical protein
LARIAARHLDEPIARVFGNFYFERFTGAGNNLFHIFFRKFIQYKDARARKKRRDNFKTRIFGRRADKGDVAALDEGQKKILLRFIEAMNFVDE